MFYEKKDLTVMVKTIPPIATKQTITSRLNLFNIIKKKTTACECDVGGPGLGQAKNCCLQKKKNPLNCVP